MNNTTTTLITAFVWLAIMISCTSPKNNAQNENIDQLSDLPNIILMMGDDHGWDEVGYNGHPFVKTPVLDEMAESGLRFDRFYSGHPSCSPTRGSFLTGRHPNRYGTFTPGYSIRPEEITLADIVTKAGYATAHFGKWHLGPVKKESPTNPGAMGFDEWFSHDNFFEMDPVMSRNGNPPQKVEGEGSEIIIEETIRFIEKSTAQDKPFMAVVWFGSPHEPYSGLPKDLNLYANLPDSLNEQETSLTSNDTGERVTRKLGEVLQERCAEITAMDRSIGMLREYLANNDLKNNTLVLYCGDNGTPPSANRTGMTIRGQKGNLYEGGVRVPGVIEWPAGIKKPAITSAVAVTSDLLPTVADLTGQSLPERPLDGESLVNIFDDPSMQRNGTLCFWSFGIRDSNVEALPNYIEPELQEGTTPLVKKLGGRFTRNFRNYKFDQISEEDYSGQRSILKDQYKLLLEGATPSSEGFELYDIEKDPAETENLADQYPDLVREMQAALLDWQQSVLSSLTGADYKK